MGVPLAAIGLVFYLSLAGALALSAFASDPARLAVARLVFLALASSSWLLRPSLLPALLYGIGTVVFPLFIMQPSFGLGIAASRTPHPGRARLKSLATHTVFGIGLYLCGIAMSQVLP
mgnify:CR=1 FL=1